MSEVVQRFVKAKQATGKSGQREQQRRSPKEQRALDLMRREADRYGVELENDGEGGLPSSLVLAVMRRDRYRCKKCGKRKGATITVHHKGGIVESEWLSNKGHTNDPNNIVTLCIGCHDEEHDEAREKGVDSSQIKPKGDAFKGQHGHA